MSVNNPPSTVAAGSLEDKNFSCVWKIPNFKSIFEYPKISLYSPVFCSACFQYNIVIHYDKSQSNKISLCSALIPNCVSLASLTCFSLYTLNHLLGQWEPIGKMNVENGLWQMVDIKSLNDNHFLKNGELQILCECKIGRIYKVRQTSKLSKDFGILFNTEMLSDVKLMVQGEKFFAHKVILSARSPVFKAMFTNDMIEVADGVVKIDDMKPEVFKTVLQYIYCEKITDLYNKADELLIAADKYDIASLKSICEKVLSENLCLDNVVKALNLAHHCNARLLKSKAIAFIKGNLQNVVKNQDFHRDMPPDLYKEILLAMASPDPSPPVIVLI